MEPPTTRPNPVRAARRVQRRHRSEEAEPDWVIDLLATYDPDRPAAWTNDERNRWRRAWALLSPPE